MALSGGSAFSFTDYPYQAIRFDMLNLPTAARPVWYSVIRWLIARIQYLPFRFAGRLDVLRAFSFNCPTLDTMTQSTLCSII